MTSADADMALKARMVRVLWSLGHSTRLCVKVPGSQVGEPRERRRTPFELTDIDVLGIKVSADLQTEYTVVDCTTRSRVSPINRAFWLRGVMDYFGARQGYLVLTAKVPLAQRVVAERLSVTFLDDETLRRLETTLPSLPSDTRIGDREAETYLQRNLRSVGAQLHPMLTFKEHEFWMNPAGRNVLRSISVVKRAATALNPEQKFHRALFLDVLGLFCLSLLQICGRMFRANPGDFQEALRLALFGGPEGIRTRESFLKHLEKVVNKASPQHKLFADGEARKLLRLEPPYFEQLAERAVRLVNRPGQAKDILRYLQVVLHQGLLPSETNASMRTVFGDSYSDISLKFVRDVSDFLVEATGVNPALGSEVAKATDA